MPESNVIRAEADNRFLLKYLLIGIGCVAFAFWATYDAFVKYPALLEKSIVLEELKTENEEAADWQARWKEVAIQNGWTVKVPSSDDPSGYKMVAMKRPTETPKEVENNIIWQYIFMALGAGIGVPCIIWFFRNRGTWIESTPNGLSSSWGQSLDFSNITQFDKKKWEKKGIGVLTYDTAEGPQTFVIDDLKFHRQNTDAIVYRIESNIDHTMIVNGEPEPNPEHSERPRESSDVPAS